MTNIPIIEPDLLKSVFLEDMGCQMNRLDAETVMGRLLRVGFRRVSDARVADVVLYYTCSVREHAEDKVYGRLGALKALKADRPELIIGVMGCMAQNHKELIFKRAPHVDLVCGTSRFEDIVELLEEVRDGQRVLAVDERELGFARDVGVRPRRHQAFVSVMRGCNKFCTFCIVPFTQGRERSRPPGDVVDEVKRLADDGVIEVTLLGQRIDTYGLDLDSPTRLAHLLARLHEEVPSLARIGFITSHPNHIDRELARTIAAHPRVSRYFHLPVQSGSDEMLRAMNRGYGVDRYREAVAVLREEVPDISLATDWIVGFPGETDADFEASLALHGEVDFHASFVFKYSPRSGTRAFELGDPVPRAVKEARNQALLDAQKDRSLRHNEALVGGNVRVLVEGISKRDERRWTGRTAQNHIVCFPAGRDLTGEVVDVRVTECTSLTLLGELL